LGSGNTYQNPANLRAEKSLLGFDARQRLTVAYAVDLPIGRGQRFLNGGSASPEVQFRLEREWNEHIPDGFPLAMSATPNNASSFGLGFASQCGAWL